MYFQGYEGKGTLGWFKTVAFDTLIAKATEGSM